MTKVFAVTKDPSAILPYGFKFTDWLVDDLANDTIASVVWTVPSGLTEGAKILTTTEAGVVLSGGTNGVTYTVGCKFTTTGGYVDERSIQIVVKDR